MIKIFISLESAILAELKNVFISIEKMSKNEQKVTKLWPLQNSSPIILVQTIVKINPSVSNSYSFWRLCFCCFDYAFLFMEFMSA